ncbi:MAG: type III-A CRISPR-associated RAMP protein Csm4 [Abditibacteriales bacterium]|nr:type III-A CRISPR-associated RAMP protein Csm4 [Abditibacteriales bacterium]MDW8365483.1 type III-A CRISPR-associated RAMP protein Csm4 [Abditibacteriales bacterium]
MPLHPLYLTPRGSLQGTTLPSPTIFGALCWATATLYDEVTVRDLCASFEGEPRFVVSDAFPFVERDGRRLHFFPMPLLPERLPATLGDDLKSKQEQTIIAGRQKKLKGARYLSENLFAEVVSGRLDAQGLLQQVASGDALRRGDCLLTQEEATKFGLMARRARLLTDADVTHNEIDRVTLAVAEGRLFQREELFFADGAGLWCLMRVPAGAGGDKLSLLPLLRYLSDTGFGGDRTSGKGHFDIRLGDPDDVPLTQVESADCWVSLSHYLPRPEEIAVWQSDASKGLRYNLVQWQAKHESSRSGGEAIFKPLRRLFAAGSVFPLTEKREWFGRAAWSGTHNGHPVYVGGFALPAWAKLGGGG